MCVMHGRGEVDVSGEDNLIEAAKRAKEEGRGLVLVTSHESGLDVPTASYLASLMGKTAIGIASIVIGSKRMWVDLTWRLYSMF